MSGTRGTQIDFKLVPKVEAMECLGAVERLKAMERLKRRTDFRAAATGVRAPASAFVVQARARAEHGPPRIGFTVSKQVGNAVERNRVRRRLRELVRLAEAAALHSGHDYVLVGRRAALAAPFQAMVRDLDAALHRIHEAGAIPTRSLHEAATPRPRPQRTQRRPRRKPGKA